MTTSQVIPSQVVPALDDVELDDSSTDAPQPWTDEELTALALAADPDQALDDDAVPLSTYQAEYGDLLPSWYMPAPTSSGGRRRRNAVVGSVIIFSLLFINALGLCITYGRLEVPF